MKNPMRAYRLDCWLGALGAALMLVGDLCLSVIPAGGSDSGLFLREAYLSGNYPAWRLPLLLATGLTGMALGFFTVRASYMQIKPQYRRTRLAVLIGGVIYLSSAGALHLLIGSLADWTSTLAPLLGRMETAELIQAQYDRVMPAMLPAMSAMDDWGGRIAERGTPVLVIIEGLTMYLSEAEVQRIFTVIAGRFDSAAVFVETMNPTMAKRFKEKSIEGSHAKFTWGVRNGAALAALLPMLYPLIRDGRFKSRFLQKRLERRAEEMGDYVQAFMEMFGGARPYVTQRSCKNQFYSDLVTPLPEKIDVPGTQIHIFYALKMGEKYRARYQRCFMRPVIHEQDLQHEELLACFPEKWAQLVKQIVLGEEAGV